MKNQQMIFRSALFSLIRDRDIKMCRHDNTVECHSGNNVKCKKANF